MQTKVRATAEMAWVAAVVLGCAVSGVWGSGCDTRFSGTHEVLSGSGMVIEALNLYERVARHAFAPGEKLNVDGFSHGGTVAKMYSWLPGAGVVDNLVTLATPVWFTCPTNRGVIKNYCTVSACTDTVQFFASHPQQIKNTFHWAHVGSVASCHAARALFNLDFYARQPSEEGHRCFCSGLRLVPEYEV